METDENWTGLCYWVDKLETEMWNSFDELPETPKHDPMSCRRMQCSSDEGSITAAVAKKSEFLKPPHSSVMIISLEGGHICKWFLIKTTQNPSGRIKVLNLNTYTHTHHLVPESAFWWESLQHIFKLTGVVVAVAEGQKVRLSGTIWPPLSEY